MTTSPLPSANVPLNLLRTWCDGLIAHQITVGLESGGIHCPSHGFVHGRCGDAVYPLLALFKRTGEENYRTAARAVYAWSERRASQPDGSWINECDGRNSWQGTTCFSVLSLGEALRHHGDVLDPEENLRWRERLRRGADFLVGYQTFELGNINYPFSAAAALALTGTLLNNPGHLARARELMTFALGHFTANRLVWGEGARSPSDISPRGLRPIDLPYNVAESLPNLALYAELTHDRATLETAIASFCAHLHWMLPDGGWDAGWCTRLAKWTYAGSRTADGCAGGLALLRTHDLRFVEAAHRNLQLLAKHTHGGLLHGGLHLHARGLPVCIHPTFVHARGLAIALDAGLPGTPPGTALPSDLATGLQAWPEAGVTQIALGPWRASVTVNDTPSIAKRGGHPSGGSLSLLWHARTGPLLVASMTAYICYEGSNMDEAESENDRAVLTPRLEARLGDNVYSSSHDLCAELTTEEADDFIEVVARGTLRDLEGHAPPDQPSAYEFRYRFTVEAVEITGRSQIPATLCLPLVSPHDEPLTAMDERTFEVSKPGVRVRLSASLAPNQPPGKARVFNFVPGAQAVPFRFDVAPDVPVSLCLKVI